ncbi:Alpha/Beta hydrolase protein [Pestalotiopsis sp. NC0098]|nr:Alpha/Beta hydrolase protein [Pestalotiopsis sp. NC0098]
MAAQSLFEGEVAFDAPGAGKPCKTWYKILGDLGPETTPLIALHGGPGGGHEYLKPLVDLHEKHGMTVIFYDQIGCGQSTHLQEKMGDDSFWTFDLFVKELDNLVDHLKLRENGFYLLGQSWGGMLGSTYAGLRPQGLKKLVLVSSPASIPLYLEGVQGLLADLPEETRKTLEECDRKGDHESEAFQNASLVWNKKHVCRIDPMPEPVQTAFKHLKEDPTSYLTMQGPSEFVIVGTAFKGWEGFKFGTDIEVPTLLINGKNDEVTNLCFEPWFRTIPKVKWVTLEGASHMSHWEERDRFIQLCGEFLNGFAE